MTQGPPGAADALATGAQGVIRIGGVRIGTLTTWRLVLSPTTKLPTLFGRGTMLRYGRQGIGAAVSAELTPAASHNYIGRPKAPPPKPFRFTGTLVELTATSITVASGTIVRS